MNTSEAQACLQKVLIFNFINVADKKFRKTNYLAPEHSSKLFTDALEQFLNGG